MSGWVAGAVVAGSVITSQAAKSAGKKAAGAQTAAAEAGIQEQQRQFDATRELLLPYVQAGTGIQAAPGGGFDADEYLRQNPDVAADPYFGSRPEEHYSKYGKSEGRAFPALAPTAARAGSLEAQESLIGLRGPEAQQAAISALQTSPEFLAQVQQGESALLQSASATGGLRGGNIQGALAQFRPQMLAQLINQQYSRLGGLTSLGQASAVGVGAAGQQTGTNITNLLGQQGAAQAGSALASGGALAGIGTGLSQLGGFAAGGGFGGFGGGGGVNYSLVSGAPSSGLGLQLPRF